jgi:hypothetical protein
MSAELTTLLLSLVGGAFGGGSILLLLRNRFIRTLVEQILLEKVGSSAIAEAHAAILKAEGVAKDAVAEGFEFAKSVTDGQPNV